jgi:hypothetical protein
MMILDEFPEQVQQHGQNGCIRGIPVQATHDTRQVPLLMRHVLYRLIGAEYTGLEKYEDINTTNQHYPKKEYSQAAQMIKGIPLIAEGSIEYGIYIFK